MVGGHGSPRAAAPSPEGSWRRAPAENKLVCVRWAPDSSEPWEEWTAAFPRSLRTLEHRQRGLSQWQVRRPYTQWGSKSPRIIPHSGESIQPSVNSFPPHSPGARLLQWSPCGEQKQGPASTSTGLLESLDSKGEQGQERVTGGSDVHTPDWRRGRRLSNCCQVSPTTGQRLGVMREPRGRGKSSDLLEAGGRTIGKEEGGGGQRGFLTRACLWRVSTAPF